MDYDQIVPKGKDKLLAINENGQLAWNQILSGLLQEFEYDVDLGTVLRWRVAGVDSPIRLDPRVAFGAPHVNGVATWVVRERWKSGESAADIAGDYELPLDLVGAALRFENIEVDPDRPHKWIGTLVPHDNEVALLAALALAVAPAALIVAINPRYSAATFTAVMVFFGPTITHAGPIASAAERVIEVAVGGVVGLFVSPVVLPARAHDLAVEAAAQMIDLMARFLPELFAGFTRDLDQTALHAMQNRIGAAFARLDAVAVEAKHERMTRLAAEPDQAQLLRTLLRLRHDLIMIGRAAAVPLPRRSARGSRHGSRASKKAPRITCARAPARC
jgi:uncharacterized protein (DUF433 family)